MPLNAAAEKKPQPAGATPWPALIPLAHHQGKPPIPIMRPVLLVGSRHNAHLHLLSRQISKAHALIINADGKVYIRDLASRTHVYVNGNEAREADLADGDLVKLGSFTFRFQAASGMKQKPRVDETSAGQLEVEGADFPLVIDQRVMLIGRRPSCDISLVEDTCSTAHAVVFSMSGKRYVRDLGSRTGTYVNGQPVRQQEIQFGDTIRIGETLMRYEASQGVAEAPEVAATPAAADVDELEDLVGTAPLVGAGDAEAETPLDFEQAEPLPIGSAGPSLASKEEGRDPLHASADDLDFDLDSEPLANDAPPKPSDTAVIPLVEARTAGAGRRDDLDLIPVVTDEPELSASPPPAPPQPQSEPEPEPEPQERLVGDNLAGEKLSSSGTGLGMQEAAREAIDMEEDQAAPSTAQAVPPADEPLGIDATASEMVAEPSAAAEEAVEAAPALEPEPPSAPLEQKLGKRRGWFSWGRRRGGAAAEPDQSGAVQTEASDAAAAEAPHQAEPAPEPAPLPEPAPELFQPQALDEVLDLSIEQSNAAAAAAEEPLPPPSPTLDFQAMALEAEPTVQEEPTLDEQPAAQQEEVAEPQPILEVEPLPIAEKETIDSASSADQLPVEPAAEEIVADVADELLPAAEEAAPDAPEQLIAQTSAEGEPLPEQLEPIGVQSLTPAPEPEPELERVDDIFFGDESIEEISHAEPLRDEDALELAAAEQAEPPPVEAANPAAIEPIAAEPSNAQSPPTPSAEDIEVEVVEPTEPTSESAFPLETESAGAAAATEQPGTAASEPQPLLEAAADSGDAVDLAQEVQAFSGEAIAEPIIEPAVLPEEPVAATSSTTAAEAIDAAPAAGEPFAVASEAHFSSATIEPEVAATVSEPAADEAPGEEPPATEPAQVEAAAGTPAQPSAPEQTPISFELVSEAAVATLEVATIEELPIAEASLAAQTAIAEAPAAVAVEPALEEPPLVEIEEMDLPQVAQEVATVETIEPSPQSLAWEAGQQSPVAELEPSISDEGIVAADSISSAADAIPDLTEDVAAAEAAAAQSSPMLIPGMALFDATAEAAPDFIGGLPLVLNELPAPPPTFGRVQVSFGGEVPRALADDDDEPGPFDSLQIDIDNPVPGAATGSYFGEVPAFDEEDWGGAEDEVETATDEVGGEQQQTEEEVPQEYTEEYAELPAEGEAQAWDEAEVEAGAPAEVESTAQAGTESVSQEPTGEEPSGETAAEPEAMAEPEFEPQFETLEPHAEARSDEPASLEIAESEGAAAAGAPVQEAIAQPQEQTADEAPLELLETEAEAPQAIDDASATEVEPQQLQAAASPEPPAAKPKSLFASRRSEAEEPPIPDPDGFEVPPPGFSQSPAQVFGGLASPAAPGRDVDVFSQGFSADLSNDPFFGGAVKPLPTHELPPRGGAASAAAATGRKGRPPMSAAAKRPMQLDPQIDEIASKLADDLGAPDGTSIVEDDGAPAPLARRNRNGGIPTHRSHTARNDLAMADRGGGDIATLTAPQSQFAAAPKPRRGYRVGILLLIMFFLMATAFGVIYTFMKQHVSLQGSIGFQNFGQLPVAEQRRLQDGQKQIMVSDHLREVALIDYRTGHPTQPAGFLGQPLEFARNETRVKWDGATMFYRLENVDLQDADRLKSVLRALKELDSEMVATADKNRIELENLRRTVDQKTKDLDALKARRERAQATVERQFSPDHIQALAAEKSAAEEKWKQAVAVRSAADAELKRLEESAAAAGNNPTTNPANSLGATAARSSDAELAKMQTDLEQMTARLSAARGTVADQADQARKALDDAQEKFLGDVEKLQGVLKDNPELSAFVSAAQRLQETAQKLSGDLLERTQKTYERQVQEKRDLDDRIANRRKELWEADKEVKRLKDDLGMRERGYNAAVANGYDKEADQIKGQMDQSLEKIRLRQMELENDPILVTLNEFSAKRQQEIAITQKQLEADRKQAESLSKELEKNFAQLAPSVEKLPENQKAFAQRMAAKVEAINNARKSYAEALERKNTQADPTLKFIEEQVQLLSAKIEDRKKAMAAMNSQQLTAEERQQRQAFLDQKRAAFDDLKKVEREAYNLYFEKMKTSEMAANDVVAATKAREELDRVTQQLFTLRDQELPQISAQLKQKEQFGTAVAYPAEPRFEEPKALSDQRPLYTLGAVAGIALVFSLLIAFTGGSAARTYHAAAPSPYLLPPAGPGLEGTMVDPLSGARVPKGELLAIPAAAHSAEESAMA